MEIESLYYFKEICELHHFSKAAEKCNISQSSLSKKIQALENELGFALFTREHRSFTLTEKGRIVLKHAEDILSEASAMQSELKEFDAVSHNTVRITLLSYAVQNNVSRAITQYFLQNPDIANELTLMKPGGIKSRLDQNIRSFYVSFNYGIEDRKYEKICLRSENLSVLIPKGHPFYENEEISIQDLQGQNVCALDTNKQLRSYIDEILKNAHIFYNVCHEDSFMESITQTAILNQMLLPSLKSLYPASFIYDSKILEFKEHIPIDIILFYPKSMILTDAERHFVEYMYGLLPG